MVFGQFEWYLTAYTMYTHSQKQLVYWAIDVMVEFYACLFRRSLMCNSWTVILLLKKMSFWLTWLEIIFRTLTFLKSLFVKRNITPGNSLMNISTHNWTLTESCLRWWWTVKWAIPSESASVCMNMMKRRLQALEICLYKETLNEIAGSNDWCTLWKFHCRFEMKSPGKTRF